MSEKPFLCLFQLTIKDVQSPYQGYHFIQILLREEAEGVIQKLDGKCAINHHPLPPNPHNLFFIKFDHEILTNKVL